MTLPMMHIEMLGLPEMVAILARQGASIAPHFAAALLEEAHIAFRESQVEVPFRTGVLKGSGRVDGPMVEGDRIVVDISYGGAASAYAYIMHRGTMRGKPIHYHSPGTKKNYLSDPVERVTAGMDTRLAARIQAMIDGV